MDYSQDLNDKEHLPSVQLKSTKDPVVICLDSQSEHEKDNPENLQIQDNQEGQQDLPKDYQVKKTYVKRSKKSKKQTGSILQIEDDDNEIVGQNRKSLRISRKKPQKYRIIRKIKRQNPDFQRRNRKKELQNIVPPFIIGTANSQGSIDISVNERTNEEKNVQTLQKDSGSIYGNIFPLVEVKNDNIKESNILKQFLEIREKKDMNLEKDLQIPFENEIDYEKNHKQMTIQTKNQKHHQNLTLQQKQNSKTSGIYLKPSQKFQKQFIEKKNVTDRRDAILNALLTNQSSKPQKYLNFLGENSQKSKQLDFPFEDEQKNSKSKEKDAIKKIPTITIQSSDDQDKIQIVQIAKKSDQPIEVVSAIQPIQKDLVEQNDKFSYLSQNLKIFYAEPHIEKKSTNQNVQNCQREVQHLYYIVEPAEEIRRMEPEDEELDLQQLPAQKYVKQRLHKKITKKTIFYSTIKQVTETWQNSEYISVQEEYPFYSQKLKPKCNLFTDKLHLILSIKKCENSQNYCTVFYESQFNQKYQFDVEENLKEENNFSTIKIKQNDKKPLNIRNQGFIEQLPQNVELDKIRLLYPQKLLDFYEMADMIYSKKVTIDESETVYDLPERTQDMIKHRYR